MPFEVRHLPARPEAKLRSLEEVAKLITLDVCKQRGCGLHVTLPTYAREARGRRSFEACALQPCRSRSGSDRLKKTSTHKPVKMAVGSVALPLFSVCTHNAARGLPANAGRKAPYRHTHHHCSAEQPGIKVRCSRQIPKRVRCSRQVAKHVRQMVDIAVCEECTAPMRAQDAGLGCADALAQRKPHDSTCEGHPLARLRRSAAEHLLYHKDGKLRNKSSCPLQSRSNIDCNLQAMAASAHHALASIRMPPLPPHIRVHTWLHVSAINASIPSGCTNLKGSLS